MLAEVGFTRIAMA